MSILSYDHVIDCHCDMLLSASNSEYSGGNVFAIPDNLKEVMKVLLLDRLAARGDYARLGAYFRLHTITCPPVPVPAGFVLW